MDVIQKSSVSINLIKFANDSHLSLMSLACIGCEDMSVSPSKSPAGSGT